MLFATAKNFFGLSENRANESNDGRGKKPQIRFFFKGKNHFDRLLYCTVYV